MSRVWAVIAGGGTAGHVLPGISIADEMTRRGVPAEDVRFVGGARGVEARLVADAGYAVTTLPGRGLRRSFRPGAAAVNLLAAVEFARACLRSLLLMRRLKPAVVVGLGGYASAPCAMAAVLLRVPLVVTEQNAVAGTANRLLSRFAAASATAFDSTGLKGAVCTGNPLRSEVIAAGERAAAPSSGGSASGGSDDRRLVAVFGGSLGARSINRAVAGALELWHDREDLRIRHISGPGHFDDARGDQQRLRQQARDRGSGSSPDSGPERGLVYDLVAYEDDMAGLYAAADLVVARSGATTVAELAAVGVPSLLAPLPGAPGDHQTANARVLESAGGAVIVRDSELTPARLAAEVDKLLEDPQRLEAMAEAARSLARPDAARVVVDLIESRACRSRPGKEAPAP